MTKEQKHFIVKKLIPFIMREQGRGFAMSRWWFEREPGSQCTGDGIRRRVPNCGTVCCIGGSVQVLRGEEGHFFSPTLYVREALGLSEDETVGLCYNWAESEGAFNSEVPFAWPMKFRSAFARAKTPLGKAKVACRLLKEVVRTEGKCLRLYEGAE